MLEKQAPPPPPPPGWLARQRRKQVKEGDAQAGRQTGRENLAPGMGARESERS